MSRKMSEVERLASEVGSVRDERRLPKLLLRMEKILSRAVSGSAQAAAVKQEIWKFDLLHLLLATLRRDFSGTAGTWETALRLAELAYTLMVNMYVSRSEDPEETFEKKLVPQFCDNLLVLAKRLQDSFVEVSERKVPSELAPDKLVQIFDRTIGLLLNYLRQKRAMIRDVVHSPWFLQLFVTDDTETPLSLLKLLRACISYRGDLCRTMDKGLFESLIEEMIYDLAAGDSAEVAGETIRTLLAIVRNFPDALEPMILKYNGLRLLVSKWTGSGGFGREMQDFLRLLDSKSGDRATMQLKVHAAVLIQAYWRGYKDRRGLANASKSLAKFQRKVRRRQQTRKTETETSRVRQQLEYEVAMRRRKLLTEKKEMEVKLMSGLPAKTVRAHVQQQQAEAAVRIQSKYKAYRERGRLEERRSMAKVVKAATTIQRAVRRWLRALQRERMMEKLQRAAPVSEETRAEILEDIAKQQYLRKPKARSREELTDLYRTSQAMMHEFVLHSLRAPKDELERDATLGRLEADAQLLTSAPKLEAVAEEDVYRFTSNSTPAQIHAQRQHRRTLRRLQCTGVNWWRGLRLEDEDDVDEEANYLERRKDVLYIDGRVY